MPERSERASRLALPAQPRVRRSHAERAGETRARIKVAVIEAIDELGFKRTTASEIARRAGVTWGAVQHHFGDKQGILLAVLQDSTNRLLDQLAAVSIEGKSLEERVALFVDQAWEHFASSYYRSTFEILLNLGSEEGLPELPRTLAEQRGARWAETWNRFFPDANLPASRNVALQHYVTSVLSGMASLRILEGASPALRSFELGFLEDTLVRELAGGQVCDRSAGA
jgi:AcrR family transcriptional regulator